MTKGGFETGRSHPDPASLFFSIPKLVSFKKLNRDGAEMGKFSNSPRLHFIFKFYFFICFFYFYYIKINIFIKIKNIMNFYKLFIKKHYNNYYYLY